MQSAYPRMLRKRTKRSPCTGILLSRASHVESVTTRCCQDTVRTVRNISASQFASHRPRRVSLLDCATRIPPHQPQHHQRLQCTPRSSPVPARNRRRGMAAAGNRLSGRARASNGHPCRICKWTLNRTGVLTPIPPPLRAPRFLPAHIGGLADPLRMQIACLSRCLRSRAV